MGKGKQTGPILEAGCSVKLNTQEKRMRATVLFIYNFIIEVSEKIVTYAVWKKKLFERAFNNIRNTGKTKIQGARRQRDVLINRQQL